ncbi:MAG: hypothetical protein J6O03_03515 [Butyrivibrio sp.]|nr:hypothetical protein [Butyrivibrio sp.]MBP3241418.1 hypothetical protein [Oribacterium sp.]MBP3825296.1 hypothetical protein [Butyrivibrio sp.]
MKGIFKKAVSVLCAAIMVASLAGCDVNVSSSLDSNQSAAEYNAEYLADNLELESEVATVIANKLDEKDLGKIKSHKKKIVNGNGSMTFGDGKKKYTINVEDGYISTLTDSDGMVIMTLDDILSAANGDVSTEPEPVSEPVSEPAEPEAPAAEPEVTDNTTQSSSSTTASYLAEDAQKILNSLDTDYNKVNWGVQYSPTGMDGIVISVAPFMDGNSYYLLVAVTNLYGEDVTFSASGYPKGTDGQKIGSISFYENAIAPGNTVAKAIYCEEIPTGEIRWDEIELPNVFDKSAYWESDWGIKTDSDGYIEVPFTIYSDVNMMPGTVTAIILDSKGDILAVEDDFIMDEGKEVSGTIKLFKKELPGTPVDLAMFANPLEK